MKHDVPSPEAVWFAKRLSPNSALVSSILDPEDFRSPAPPEGVHWLGRPRGVFWDPYGADALSHSLSVAGLTFEPGCRYLDFGCSSGRTVRTLAAAYPGSKWYGCDPVTSSIDWASQAMPHIEFYANPEAPPTDYADGQFDGVYAVSVWTHFSKDMAVRWFDEMHRIIAPGGFLAFSAAGAARLARGLRRTRRPEQRARILHVWHSLLRDGFVFFASHAKGSHPGSNTEAWGLTRMTLEWVVHQTSTKWALLAFDPARYGPGQDIYVLQRRSGGVSPPGT